MNTDSYEIYSQIRDKFGYRDSTVAVGTGITKSTFSDWKAGRYQPKTDKLQKIADFLGVSLEHLMKGEEDETYYLNDDTRRIAQEVFENKELRMLMDEARDAEPEDISAIHSMLLALKRKERGTIE